VRRAVVLLLAVAAFVGITRPAALDRGLAGWEHLAGYVAAQR
jgi:hypothetical protein